MDVIEQAIEHHFGLPASFVWRLLWTVIAIVVWVLLRRLSRLVLSRIVDDPASRFQLTKFVGYVLLVAFIVAFAKIWVQGVTGLATYFGLLSAGFAIALQDPIINSAGWLFILWRRPYRVGDRVQIGPHAGDVVDIRPFRTVLLEIGNWVHADQSTGRVLHIPNGWVFKNSVANYDEAIGYIWNELEVVVTFESDWRAAKRILEQALADKVGKVAPDVEKHIAEGAHEMHIQFSKVTPVVWTSVVDSGVRLTMRYLCRSRERRSSASAIWEAMLDAFAATPNVDLAYPTTRYFDNVVEGKPGARAGEPKPLDAAAPRPAP